MIFIVGCPRSGTTWLQQLLASHPKARTGIESQLFNWYIGPQIRAWRNAMKRQSLGLGGYLREAEFINLLRQYMIGLLQPMISSLGQDEFFIEKTPSHALYLPEIMEFLPKSRIIHIIRDGRDVVASLLAASRDFLGGWAPTNSKDAASIWVKHIKAVQSATKDIPKGQFYEIRYEDLLRSTPSAMKKLCDFLNLVWNEGELARAIENNSPNLVREMGTRIPVSGEFHEASGQNVAHEHGFLRKGKEGSWKKDLTPFQKFITWRTAHTTMNEVGYIWKHPW